MTTTTTTMTAMMRCRLRAPAPPRRRSASATTTKTPRSLAQYTPKSTRFVEKYEKSSLQSTSSRRDENTQRISTKYRPMSPSHSGRLESTAAACLRPEARSCANRRPATWPSCFHSVSMKFYPKAPSSASTPCARMCETSMLLVTNSPSSTERFAKALGKSPSGVEIVVEYWMSSANDTVSYLPPCAMRVVDGGGETTHRTRNWKRSLARWPKRSANARRLPTPLIDADESSPRRRVRITTSALAPTPLYRARDSRRTRSRRRGRLIALKFDDCANEPSSPKRGWNAKSPTR
mmetsp:Transcript_3198/g.10738  ORF Transcript_3198/g.10738 Transcript_3198/m.10738 type:complete len:292 (-) Transcript_3198:1776-2651(-)